MCKICSLDNSLYENNPRMEYEMKKILVFILFISTFNTQAEITTKEQADKFLNSYCIALVNEIEKAVEKQKKQAKDNDWDNFMKTGAWISGISDVYSKLCK